MGEFSNRIKDVRLMKHRDSGNSRGFGFIEFVQLSDAVDFMDKYRGEYLLNDRWRLELKYSTSKAGDRAPGGPGGPPGAAASGGVDLPDADWMCAKCSGRNFKRRENCFKCGLSKADSVRFVNQDGNDDVGTTPSTTLLLRGLDALTQEDNIR